MKEGDRIIFLQDITESANEEHPDYILAMKDQFGTLSEQRKRDMDGAYSNEWWNVYWDGWKAASFAAQINVDFKLVGETPTEIAAKQGITVTGNDTFNDMEKAIKEGKALTMGEYFANLFKEKK
jgi:hypothetical protein